MRLRNKSSLWYRADGMKLAPGAVAEVEPNLAERLLTESPWVFERAGAQEKGGRDTTSTAPVPPNAPAVPEPPAEKKRKRSRWES